MAGSLLNKFYGINDNQTTESDEREYEDTVTETELNTYRKDNAYGFQLGDRSHKSANLKGKHARYSSQQVTQRSNGNHRKSMDKMMFQDHRLANSTKSR